MGLLAAESVSHVVDSIKNAQAHGDSLVQSVMTNLSSVANALTTQSTLFAQSVGSVSLDINIPPPPTLHTPPPPIPFNPTPINFGDLPPLEIHQAPEPPNMPTQPQNTLGEPPKAPDAFDGKPPDEILTFEKPPALTRPTLLIPNLPTLEPVVFTPFMGTRPEYKETDKDLESPPDDIKKWDDQDPNSLINKIDQLKNSLEQKYNTPQSMGFPSALWDNLYAEYSGKSLRAYVEAEADALRMDSALGFHSPTGTARAKMLKLRTENLAAQNEFARTKTIERINREVAYKDKIFDVLNTLPQLLYQADKDTKDRLLAAQDHANTVLMQLYDLYLKGFMGAIEARKEGIEVYRNQLQAFEQEIRIHSALIDAEKTKKEFNAALIEKYSMELSVNKNVIDAYKTEIEQNIALGRIEELKLKVFELKVAGFDAKTKAYSAYIQGKSAEANAFAETVKAYQSEIQGYSAELGAIEKQYAASSDFYKIQLGVNQAQVDAFKAKADAIGMKARAEADFATVNNQANSLQAQVIASFNEVNAKVWEATAQAQISQQTAAVQMSKINLDAVQAAKAIASEAQSTMAKVYAQLISSALSQQHYSTTASGDANLNATYSEHLDLGTFGQKTN